VLRGHQNLDVKQLRLRFQPQRQGAEFDSFGTRAEDEENALQEKL
jgi:hypothetical protein